MSSSCLVELLQLFVLNEKSGGFVCFLSSTQSSTRRLHKQLKLFIRSHPSNRHELFLKGRMRLAAPGTSVGHLELEELVKSELYVRLRLTPHHVDPQEEIAPFWECHLNVKHMLFVFLDHSSQRFLLVLICGVCEIRELLKRS